MSEGAAVGGSEIQEILPRRIAVQGSMLALLTSSPTTSPSVIAGAGALLRRRHTTSVVASVSLTAASSSNTPVKREHLITEPGFGRRFCLSLAVLASISYAASFSTGAWLFGMAVQARASDFLQFIAHRLEWWSVLGLLSSSCCVLQLILNAFSFGCAGFNTVLGPLRPYFLALTTFLQACVWRQTLVGRAGLQSAVGGTVLSAVLVFLPEMLHVWVHRERLLAPMWPPLRPQSTLEDSAEADAVGLCRLQVSGMGCTACTAKVKAALESIEGVAGCEVALEEATATLRLGGGAAAQTAAVEAEAIAAVTAAGFPAARAIE